MDAVFGISGEGWVILAADASCVRSIMTLKTDYDKIKVLDDHKIMATAGGVPDRSSFTEYIEKNMTLYALRNELTLSMSASASFIRNQLASALRRAPFQVNTLLAGVDTDGKASLYWMDYLAASSKVEYGAHGYAAYFLYGLLDRKYRPDLTFDEGLEVINACIAELQERFLVGMEEFYIKAVTSDGVQIVREPEPAPSGPFIDEDNGEEIAVDHA